jgi:homocysteine S-methyltransferase
LSRATAFTIGGGARRVDAGTLREAYEEQALLLADAGVDLIVLEMIMAPGFGEAALAAARATGLPVWLGLSAERAADGRLACWQNHELDFDDLLARLVAPDLAAVLVMHTDVADVDDALEAVLARWDGPVGVYPHAGVFEPPNWRFDESFTPVAFVEHARGWVDRGARIVGGCCGLGPRYIEALSGAFA